MARMPKPVKRFEIPIYGGEVFLYKDQKEFWKAYNFLKDTNDEDDGLCGGETARCCHKETGRVVYLVGWYSGRLSTLAHEVTHVAIFLLEHVGIDPRDSNAEPMAYLVGYLIDKLQPS